MKKVASILAVAVMALGLMAYAIENSNNDFDSSQDLTNTVACDECVAEMEERGSGS